MKQYKIHILFLVLIFASCQTLNETYPNTGSENNRSVGKCENLTIESGWKRLRLNWENSVDPAIETIRLLAVQGEDTILTEMLPAETVSYQTDTIFSSRSVEFILTAIDIDGNQSISTSKYARAFDDDSEQVGLWKTLRRSHYFLKGETENKLIVFLYDSFTVVDNDTTWNVLSSNINYSIKGVETSREITKQELTSNYVIVDQVDIDKDVSIEKTMKLEECFDTIYFKPSVLAKFTDEDYKNYAPDFLNEIKTKYDAATNIDAMNILDTLSVLYIDKNISSFENIMYMPKLEKIMLGANRYMSLTFSRTANECSQITDNSETSLLALQMMHELNGVEINLYGNHYGLSQYSTQNGGFINYSVSSRNYPSDLLPGMEAIGSLEQPSGEIVGGWSLNTDSETSPSSGPLKSLIGARITTNMFTGELSLGSSDIASVYWSPIISISESRSHEIYYDMLEEKDIKGFFFRQYSATTDIARSLYPEAIEVEYSTNGVDWQPIFDTFNFIYVGTTPQEITLIEPVKEIKTRYLKLIIKDKVSVNGNYLFISKFFPYFK